MKLYKRNNNGDPIFWEISRDESSIVIHTGLVGKPGMTDRFTTTRDIVKDINSRIAAKRKEGYKELSELRDNTNPELITDIKEYLNLYLPKFNTSIDGNILPMLAKTVESDKTFKNGEMMGQWKINGVRCIVGIERVEGDLFRQFKFTYQSREGTTWDLSWMDDVLYFTLEGTKIFEAMLDEGAHLDGELYLPGYGINEINSFVKNNTLPQHYKLQYWIYDICIENYTAFNRNILLNSLDKYIIPISAKEDHLNNANPIVVLPTTLVDSLQLAIHTRDKFINLGFEGLILRDPNAEYAFGKRNSSMWKYKKIEDGMFEIVDIIPEGKRIDLPKFVCKNDINNSTFEVTLNAPQDEQRQILINKELYIKKKMFVEYRERSGINKVPFHAKGIKIV